MTEITGAAEYVEYVVRDIERLEGGTLVGDVSSQVVMVLRLKGLWGGFGDEAEELEGGGRKLSVGFPGLWR